MKRSEEALLYRFKLQEALGGDGANERSFIVLFIETPEIETKTVR